MPILRHILAMLLALQIVNPMCDCDGSTSDSSCQIPDEPVSTCCSSQHGEETSKQSDKEESENDPHLCMCSEAPNFSQDTKVNLPAGPLLTDLPPLLIIELPDPIKDQPEMLAPVKNEKHPPGPDIRVLFSSFLI